MAKQNFLSGGYYGKLGQTVGQRWKNIRTVRSYVIPANPRTESQQANRGQFGDCVYYAQIGMQLNYKAPCFEASDKTAWNYRMSTARALQDLGLTQLERFPLYPVNFAVPYTISAATLTEIVDATHVVVTVDGTLPEKERVLTMLLLLPGDEDWKSRLSVCIGQNSSDNYNEFTFQLPDDLDIQEGMQCRFISCDDTDSTTDLIASSQIELSYTPVDVHTFDTTVTSVSRTDNIFTFTFAEPYQVGQNSITVGSLYAVRNGSFETIVPDTVEFINNNGYFAVAITCGEAENQNLWAFPSGSSITIDSVSTISTTVEATAENVTESVVSTDLSRTYDNSIASVSRSGATFTLAFTATAPAQSSQNVSVDVHAVSNGAFGDFTFSNATLTSSGVSFTQSYTNEQEILAFASGSTATLTASITANGVTYTASTSTAQSLTSTDLTRNITGALTLTSSGGEWEVKVQLDGTITSAPSSFIGAILYNPFIKSHLVSNVSISGSIEGSAYSISTLLETDLPLFLSGSYIAPNAAQTLVASGVNYMLTASQYSLTQADYTAELGFIVGGMFDNSSIGVYWGANADSLPSGFTGVANRQTGFTINGEDDEGDNHGLVFNGFDDYDNTNNKLSINFLGHVAQYAEPSGNLFIDDVYQLPIYVAESGVNYPALIQIDSGTEFTNDI